jgi:hypothetical protein
MVADGLRSPSWISLRAAATAGLVGRRTDARVCRARRTGQSNHHTRWGKDPNPAIVPGMGYSRDGNSSCRI